MHACRSAYDSADCASCSLHAVAAFWFFLLKNQKERVAAMVEQQKRTFLDALWGRTAKARAAFLESRQQPASADAPG